MYCKIENNQIIQCSIHPDSDLVWVENGVCGMVRSEDGTFQNPIPTLEQIFSILRIERNARLAETDWRMHSDYPGTDKQLWLDYRQALRDLPATAEPKLDDVGNLTNVDWPEVPE